MMRGLRPAILLLAGYFFLSALIRIFLSNSLTLDEAEQSYFSQVWLLGYGPQPPFYNWLQNCFVWLFGISVTALAFPKFLMLFACYLLYGLAAREVNARPGFASLAMLALMTLPQLSYMPQQDLTHTVAVLMATSLLLYGLFRALRRADALSFVIVGIAVGIGCISKYNFVLLPAAALLAIICERSWRSRLLDSRLLLAVAVAAAIILPHAIWLVGNMELASTGTLSKMAATGGPGDVGRIVKAILSLLVACLAFGALTALIFGIAYRRNLSASITAGDEWTRLLGRMMIFSLAGVLVVIVVTGTTKITERWLDPYLLVLPLYILLKLDRGGTDTVGLFPRLFPIIGVIMVITLVVAPVRVLVAGVTGSFSRLNQPIEDISLTLRKEAEPALVLADTQHLAGNMRLQFPGAIVKRLESWQSGEAAPDGPILIVWGGGDSEQPAPLPNYMDGVLRAFHADGAQSSRLSLPYRFSGGNKMYSLSYMWLNRKAD